MVPEHSCVERQSDQAAPPQLRRQIWRRRPLGGVQLSLLRLALLLGGCLHNHLQPSSPPKPTRLTVVSTVAPVALFPRAVAGDCAEVTSLLLSGTGLHGFQSRPSDLLSLRRAWVLVINGLALGSCLGGLRRSAATSSLCV